MGDRMVNICIVYTVYLKWIWIPKTKTNEPLPAQPWNHVTLDTAHLNGEQLPFTCCDKPDCLLWKRSISSPVSVYPGVISDYLSPAGFCPTCHWLIQILANKSSGKAFCEQSKCKAFPKNGINCQCQLTEAKSERSSRRNGKKSWKTDINTMSERKGKLIKRIWLGHTKQS